MGFVLKADGVSADAWVEKAFSAQTDIWVTLDLRFDASLIASEDPGDLGYGPAFFQLQKTGAGDDQGGITNPDGAGGVGLGLIYQFPLVTLGAPLSADIFHTVELHVVGGSPHTAHLYVDGTDLGSVTTSHNVASWDGIHVGIFFTWPDSRQVYLIDNVRVGTSRGASDVFSDDFETSDLSAWDSFSGDVSVISGGGPTISSFAPSSGSAGDSVTITGTGFTGATSVAFAGRSAASFVINSDTEIVAVVPGGAVTGRITVTNPDGTATSSSDFAITPLNSSCANALPITGATGSYDADNRTVDGNWVQPDPLWLTQNNNPGSTPAVGGGAPLWWKFTNTFGRPVVIEVFIDPFDAGTDATNLIAGLFLGDCDDFNVDPENPMAFGVPGGVGLNWNFIDVTNNESILLAMKAGQTVYLEIDGYSEDTTEPPTLPPEGSMDEAEYNGRGTWALSWEVRDATLQDVWNYPDSHEETTSDDSRTAVASDRPYDYAEFDDAFWFISGRIDGTTRVVRWDGASTTVYALPTEGSTTGDRPPQLATDGLTLWAVYDERVFVSSPDSSSWDPVRIAIDVWNGAGFDRLDTIEAFTYNTVTAAAFGDARYKGGIGGFDASADPSLPGRLYVVWSECGYGASVVQTPGSTLDTWNERMVITCYGDDAPFSAIEWRNSTEFFSSYASNGFAATSCCVARSRVWLTTDDGACHLWLNPPRQGFGAFSDLGAYNSGLVETWTINDDESVDLSYEIGFSDGTGVIPDPDPDETWVESGFAVEPACSEFPSIGAADEVWAFLVLGSDFPGDHPDYTVLGELGVTGVLWRDTDPDIVAGMASTRAAGFAAGVWTVSGEGQTAASFATQASDCVTDFAPDLLVLDVETEYGDDTTPEWDWHDDMMTAYRLFQPTQETAVTTGPLKDDFNYAAYTGNDCTVWPQSYPTDLADCTLYDPITVTDRVVANGVDSSLVTPVLAAPCYPAHVTELVAAGRHSWALFSLDASPAAPETESGSTEPKRTLFIGWRTNGGATLTQAYLVRCDLQGATEWYATPATAELGPPSIFAGSWNKAIYTDRFRQTWWTPRDHTGGSLGGIKTTYFFDRMCLNEWVQMRAPRVDGLPVGQTVAHILSQHFSWQEPADLVRWASLRYDPNPTTPTDVIGFIETAYVTRKGALCLVGDLVASSTIPYFEAEFRAERLGEPAASLEANSPAHLSGIVFRAELLGNSEADTAADAASHLSQISFRAE